jgi:hypothetical protein
MTDMRRRSPQPPAQPPQIQYKLGLGVLARRTRRDRHPGPGPQTTRVPLARHADHPPRWRERPLRQCAGLRRQHPDLVSRHRHTGPRPSPHHHALNPTTLCKHQSRVAMMAGIRHVTMGPANAVTASSDSPPPPPTSRPGCTYPCTQCRVELRGKHLTAAGARLVTLAGRRAADPATQRQVGACARGTHGRATYRAWGRNTRGPA